MEKRVSLRNKITTAMVLVILLLGITVTFAINRLLPEALREEASKRGISMARHLAARSLAPLEDGDIRRLEALAEGEKALGKDVAYVFVVDGGGRVLASTFAGGEAAPEILDGALRSDTSEEVRLLETPQGLVYDIAYPIAGDGGRLGTVVIGIEEASIRNAINKTLGIVIGVTLLAIALSIFIGAGLAGLIVRPVNKLRSATEQMANENLDVKLDIETGDEIQDLATSFNKMAARLKISYGELLKSNRELEKANKVKSDFLAVMSHELRTPLTAILGFSELLQEGVMGELNREQEETLGEVMHNAADLLNMINCMLDLTRIESGKMQLESVRFDLSEMLRRAGRTISPIVQKKNVELRIDIPDGVFAMEGDERKIQQTVLNLLTNAAKFTPEGWSISLTADYFGSWDEVDDKDAFVRRFTDPACEFRGGGVVIVVEDTGIGIPEEHFDRVFDSFYQVDTSATRIFGGIGLGLSLSRQFIEMHGGCIWVDSECGNGARFTIAIPHEGRLKWRSS